MTIQTELLTLRGPRHLMSSLDMLEIDTEIDAVHYLWLNDKHQITGHSQTQEPPEDDNLIVVQVDNRNPWSDSDKAWQSEVSDDVHVLDVLRIRNKRWRSVMCTDNSCCPHDGIAINSAEVASNKPQRAAWLAQWQSWLLSHHIPEHLLESACASLRDLPLRDALLAQLAHDPVAITHWQHLRQNHGEIDDPAWLSILSSVSFLEENMEHSLQLALRASELDPQYSLAKLLIQAHEADAPRAIVLSAFSRYTSQELLDRASKDIVTDSVLNS